MNDLEPFEDRNLTDRLRTTMRYPDHGAAERLRAELMDRRQRSDRDHLPWRHLSGRRLKGSPRMRRRRVVLAAVLLLVASGAALAADSITNLGKPADIQSTAAYFPLSGFHRVSTSLQSHGKPELVFIGAQGPRYERINVERWPVVKALQQFGSLTGVKAVERTCITVTTRFIKNTLECSTPTFDLSRAHYSSRYIGFVSKDIVRSRGITPGKEDLRLFQSLSPAETGLFNRYARFKGQPYCFKPPLRNGLPASYPCSKPIDFITATLFPDSRSPTRTLPLVAIGHYLQTVSQVLYPSDLAKTIGNTPTPGTIVYAGVSQGYPFETVRQALASGHDPAGTPTLVENVNAEANIITALICHADGGKPGSVCGRHAIRTILRHVK